ncbi:MAG: hypothetical protein KF908_12200 [Nitrosomonas sp.]|jgi:hypothetical protein|uniref:Uncharacterized protein n=1 Tax=Nitrosomonas aestuarii TaxID=52441 RepID=A0A1I4FK85_9PROT|nr:hypothetical protein [Nitrosomonas aestuarii]MBX3630642.1 hypothetical protein [Nitrosomonas sp.]SFL17883.1 hypothetical protein SAMN05216302_103825 [Nitrosomonas aestuarii]
MNKLIASIMCAVLGLFFSISSHADRMVVLKGHAILLATDDHLTVLPDSPNTALSCSFDTETGTFFPAASPIIQIPVPGAMDVKVVGNHAYVATSNFENSAAATDYFKYDISACIPEGPFTPYRAHVNLTSGELVIPCVEVAGAEYNVVMNQRGNSMNWEVQFINTGCY